MLAFTAGKGQYFVYGPSSEPGTDYERGPPTRMDDRLIIRQEISMRFI